MECSKVSSNLQGVPEIQQETSVYYGHSILINQSIKKKQFILKVLFKGINLRDYSIVSLTPIRTQYLRFGFYRLCAGKDLEKTCK